MRLVKSFQYKDVLLAHNNPNQSEEEKLKLDIENLRPEISQLPRTTPGTI